MLYTQSVEDYLEAIWVIHCSKGSVQCVDIAEMLGYSKPSVSIAVRNLRDKGLLEPDRDIGVVLTESGRVLAKQVYERHVVLSKMLHSLGVNEETAAEDACRMEHVVSEESFAAIKAFFFPPPI